MLLIDTSASFTQSINLKIPVKNLHCVNTRCYQPPMFAALRASVKPGTSQSATKNPNVRCPCFARCQWRPMQVPPNHKASAKKNIDHLIANQPALDVNSAIGRQTCCLLCGTQLYAQTSDTRRPHHADFCAVLPDLRPSIRLWLELHQTYRSSPRVRRGKRSTDEKVVLRAPLQRLDHVARRARDKGPAIADRVEVVAVFLEIPTAICTSAVLSTVFGS